MTTPKPVRTSGATASNVRRGDDTAARRLVSNGWIVIPPEAQLDGATLARITAALVAAGYWTTLDASV
jgi:hypothetical protein